MFSQACVKNSVHRAGCLPHCILGYTAQANTHPLRADTPAPGYYGIRCQQAGGTHPIGMHTFGNIYFIKFQNKSDCSFFINTHFAMKIRNMLFNYKARHAHKRLYTVLPKYSKIQVLPGITSCRLMKYNKQAIELNSLLINDMPKDGYE